MCGIAGLIDWQEDVRGQQAIIETMIGRLSHRGPDAHNIWTSSCAALAHHRLAVVDPEAGKQPMVYQSSEQTFVIVFNGELYNFRELRSELLTRGHIFHTSSDTEVLLHTYIEWGEGCTQHLNGIFAFGVWDENKQQLFLARDHLGAKPLFYAECGGSTLLFGSEIKALLAHPRMEPEVDYEGLASLFTTIPVHTPGFVPYCNMYEVRPGEQMVVTREGKRVSCYWSLSSMPHTDDLGTTTERIRSLLEDIVRRQLITDLPLVAMLSGGLDSSGLVALAAKEFQLENKQLETYSIDYLESERYFKSSPMQVSHDEPWVKRVSEYVGTQHQTVTIDSAELVENLLAPVYAHDLPSFFGQLETSLYLFCKAIRRDDVTVAVSCEAADEVFGGYDWFFDEEVCAINKFPWEKFFGNQASPWWSSEVTEKIRPQEYVARRYREAQEEVSVLPGESAFDAKMREVFYMNKTRFLPILLDRNDRMSMAVGLEVRLPFSDYRLTEYVWNIPWEMKMVGGMEKGILRRALANVLPSDVRKRKKSPYPTSQHPQYQQGISQWLLHILDDPSAPIRPFLNIPVARALVKGNLPNLPGSLSVSPMEQIIKINSWLQEYNVSIR